MHIYRDVKLLKSLIPYLLILLCVSCYVLPAYWVTRNLEFNKNTDYEASLPVWFYVANTLRQTGAAPDTIPFVSLGIPVLSDPLSNIASPIFTIPLYILPNESGVRLIIFISIYLCGVVFYASGGEYLKSKGIRLWAACLYAISGTLIGQIAPGHVITLVAAVFFPVVLFAALSEKIKKLDIVVISFALASMVYAGDNYMPFFCFMMFAFARSMRGMNEKTGIKNMITIFWVGILFMVFSSAKLVPFLLYVRPTMERYFPINTYAGSLHIFLFPLSFILPFTYDFYDRPSIQRIFGFYYNWNEYYAFISPFPFIFLLALRKRVNRTTTMRYILLLLGIGCLYIANKYWYSPFHWIFESIPLLQSYRVPQRMYLLLEPLTILLLALCAQSILRQQTKKIVYSICVITIMTVLLRNQQLIIQTFAVNRPGDQQLVQTLRFQDRSNFYVTSFVCCLQSYLTDAHIPILNFYYGWRPKGSPNFLNEAGNAYNLDSLNMYRSKYIITSSEVDISKYNYEKYIMSGDRTIWKTDLVTYAPETRFE